eukprot:scaffold1.g5358.t1
MSSAEASRQSSLSLGDMGDRVDKAKRYDRGIRIWGAHGQEALEHARICLLNCGPTGSEALKNLVLGGIASFTIVDGNKASRPGAKWGSCPVQAGDLGNNFLVTAGSLGQSRAQAITALACTAGALGALPAWLLDVYVHALCTTVNPTLAYVPPLPPPPPDCLKELNETVSGSYVEEAPPSLIASNPSFFEQFSLVVATQLIESDAAALDRVCREAGVPLLLVRSYGLLGFLRVCVEEHAVIESKPDSVVDDLRLANPWPELRQYADSIDLATVEEHMHSHIPYAVLLIKAAQQWRKAHDDALPRSYAERSAFKALISSWQREVEGIPLDEENFNEAVSNAHKVWAAPGVPPELRAILDDEAASPAHFGPSTPSFWVLVATLRRFLEQEGAGLLPVEGSIPDMHATTSLYLELQRLYRDKAEADAAAVGEHVRALLAEAGREPGSISPAEVKHFCKHARYLRLVRTRPLAGGADSPPSTSGGGRADALRGALAGEDTAANAGLWVLLNASDRFHATYQRFPGVYDSEVEEDVALLKSGANSILAESGTAGVVVSDDLVAEMVRFGAGELHAVAAAVGAIASQEAIKLITRQFVPVGGTLVYNAMACTTSIFGF